MAKLLTPAEALRLIEQTLEQHAAARVEEQVSLALASGRILAEPVASVIDSPPHDKAMMDGYAVIANDATAERTFLEEITAGTVPTKVVTPGHASAIMTGAPVPEGADAVIPVEQTEKLSNGMIRFASPTVPPGKHIMRRGESMQSGQQVLEAGTLLGASHIALLAEVGRAVVPVISQPKVAILATGNELVPCDQEPQAGQIRNSNSPMLQAAASQAGCLAEALPAAGDTPEALLGAILSARNSDVLLLSGGVSAGTKDLVPDALAAASVQQVLHKIAVKPGKPLWFGVWPADHAGVRPTFVFGLPGNPVSSFVGFQLFVRPLLARLRGLPFAGIRPLPAQLASPLSHRGGRETYLPAVFNAEAIFSAEAERLVVTPVDWKGSADLAGLARANALLRLPSEAAELEVGHPVTILPLACI